jgi:hypothetical protein
VTARTFSRRRPVGWGPGSGVRLKGAGFVCPVSTLAGNTDGGVTVSCLLTSALGRVLRAQLVHTTARNCAGDEGGPFGVGNHGLISSHCKLLWSKSHGGERCSQVRAACPDRQALSASAGPSTTDAIAAARKPAGLCNGSERGSVRCPELRHLTSGADDRASASSA